MADDTPAHEDVLESIKPPVLTNVAHMLAQLLAQNIVSLTRSHTTDLLIVQQTGIYEEGVTSQLSVNYENIPTLYLLTRDNPTLGTIVWFLLNEFDTGPRDPVAELLENDDWCVDGINRVGINGVNYWLRNNPNGNLRNYFKELSKEL